MCGSKIRGPGGGVFGPSEGVLTNGVSHIPRNSWSFLSLC